MNFQERVGWLRRIDLFHSFSDAELSDFAGKSDRDGAPGG